MTIHSRILLVFLASLVIPATSSAQSEPDYTGRVPTGLQVLYDFAPIRATSSQTGPEPVRPST